MTASTFAIIAATLALLVATAAAAFLFLAAAAFVLMRSGLWEAGTAIAAEVWPSRFKTQPLQDWPSLKDGRPLSYDAWQTEAAALFNGGVEHDGWQAAPPSQATRRLGVAWH